MKIMDYSMLIAVHYIPPKVYTNQYRRYVRTFPATSKNDEAVHHRSSTRNEMSVTYNREGGRCPPGNAKTDTYHASTSAKSKPFTDQIELLRGQGTSLKDFFASIRDSEQSTSCSTLDNYLDNDDECSYLDGASRIHGIYGQNNCTVKEPNSKLFDDESRFERERSHERRMNGIKMKKDCAAEHMYWPFHRFYDLQGRRRMKPLTPSPSLCLGSGDINLYRSQRGPNIMDWNGSQQEQDWDHQRNCCLGKKGSCHDSSSKEVFTCSVPEFLPPLSVRKDGGFLMDMNGEWEKTGIIKGQRYEGKIFYMGIIDVLQQFNIRKRFEAKLRRLQGSGWADASCVHPSLYADRFMSFFDQYTVYPLPLESKQARTMNTDVESQVSSNSDHGLEEIDFTD